MTSSLFVIPVRMKSTEYFLTKARVRDVLRLIRPSQYSNSDDESLFLSSLQREPRLDQVQDIASYLSQNTSPFISPLILSMLGPLRFVPNKESAQFGTLSVEDHSCVVLDGKQRVEALEIVSQQSNIADEEIALVLIPHRDVATTQQIVMKVQRQGKPNSRGDTILISESDSVAVIARWLLKPHEPLGTSPDLVTWKTTTLAIRSTKLTTLSTVYAITEDIVVARGHLSKRGRKQRITLKEKEIDKAYKDVASCWQAVIENVRPYREAVRHRSRIPLLRADASPSALLFKPTVQLGLFRGLLNAEQACHIPLEEGAMLVDKMPWGLSDELWKPVVSIAEEQGEVKRSLITKQTTTEYVTQQVRDFVCKRRAQS